MLAVALSFGLFINMKIARIIGNTQDQPLQTTQPDRVWAAALFDLTSQPQSLAQWRGKVVVRNFRAPWCPPCRHEIPGFIRLQERFKAQGLQLVGVVLDRLEPVREYVRQTGINYPSCREASSYLRSATARAASLHLGPRPLGPTGL